MNLEERQTKELEKLEDLDGILSKAGAWRRDPFGETGEVSMGGMGRKAKSRERAEPRNLGEPESTQPYRLERKCETAGGACFGVSL